MDNAKVESKGKSLHNFILFITIFFSIYKTDAFQMWSS